MTISLKRPTLAAPHPRKRRIRRRPVILALLGLLCAGLVFWGCTLVYGMLSDHASAVHTQATKDVVEKVGRLMLLPANETPTIAVVSDLSKLQGQAFFIHAHAGDVVLMYPNAARAILYSPSQDKIIEVAPITATLP